jgi:hypothetical protein
MKNIDMSCDVFYDINIDQYDRLADFTFENLTIRAKNSAYDKNLINGIKLVDVRVNDKRLE